jgi:PAS domain S-box-containing protein
VSIRAGLSGCTCLTMNESEQSSSSSRFSGLSGRVLLYVVLCSTLLTGISLGIHYHHVRSLYMATVDHTIQLIQVGMLPALANEAQDERAQDITILLHTLTQIPGVAYVQLHSNIPGHERILEAGNSDLSYDLVKTFILPKDEKDVEKTEPDSTLRIHVSYAHIRADLYKESQYMLVLAFLFVTILSVLYFTVVQMSVTRHLSHLAHHLKQLNINNLNLSIDWSHWRPLRNHPDELDLIATRVDQLCKHLHQEIQKREDAMQEMAQRKAFFHQIVEDQTEFISRHASDGNVTYINQAMCDFMGIPREQLLHEGFTKYMLKDERERLKSVIESLTPQNPISHDEAHLMHPTLGKRLISWTTRAYYDPQGKLDEIQSTGRDITNQARAMQELRLRDLAIRSAPYGIAITNPNLPDNPAVYINPAFEKMTGYTANEILHRNLRFLHAGASDQSGLTIIRNAIHRQKQAIATVRNFRQDGTPYWVEMIIAPMHDHLGKISHFISIQTDVTERIESAKRQKLLMHELDHRVKNVLATVMALATQSLRTASDMKTFNEVFTGRIQALARAHEALANEKWAGIDMHQLVDLVLGHQLIHQTDRIDLAGPKVRLIARLSSPLCMALHELLTNALKYGALKNPIGRLTLSWEIIGETDQQSIRIIWQEYCPVYKGCCDGSHCQGFGMKLIQGLVTYEMNGTVDHTFTPDGLYCCITLPNFKNIDQT